MKSLKSFVLPLLLVTMGLSACEEPPVDNIGEAQSALKDNRFQNARIYLLNQLSENPDDITANTLYANVMLQLGDGDSALTALNKLPSGFEDLRALKAHASILRGRSNDILSQYKNIDISNLTEQDWRMFIWAQFSANMLEEGYKNIQIALQKYPKSSDLLFFAGHYHLEQSNNILALEFANKSLKYDDDNYEALNLAGRASLRLNKIDEAQSYYERSAESFPDNPIPIINLAGIAMDKAEVDKAKKYVESAERLNSSLPLTKFVKARYANLTGDNRTAKEILQDANSGLDAFGPAVFLAGKVAFELGEMSVARSRLNRSLALDPKNPEAKQLLRKIP